MAVQGLSLTNGGAFHVVGGRNVELSQEKTVALIGGTWTFKPFYTEASTYSLDPVLPIIKTRRLVFSQNPINFGDTFQVYVTQRKHQANKMRMITPPRYTYKFVPEDKSCSNVYTQQNMVRIAFTLFFNCVRIACGKRVLRNHSVRVEYL